MTWITHFHIFLMYLYISVLLDCTFRLRHRMGHLCIHVGDHTLVSGMQSRIHTFIFPCSLIWQPRFPNPVTKGYLLFCAAMHSHGLNCTVHAQSSTALHSPCTVRTDSCATMHSHWTQLHSPCTVSAQSSAALHSPCTVHAQSCKVHA